MEEIISSARINPQQIYETITRKFTYPGGKGLKRKDDTIFFSNVYDEPTYLTFRIDFDFLGIDSGDGYNDIPQGLLNVVTRDFVVGSNNVSVLPNISATDRKYIINDDDQFFDLRRKLFPNSQYSAYNYLYYALGERERARMLLQFKMGLYDIVKYCPYYITSISGLNNLMKVVPTNGVRIPKDGGVLTITCNEALDMRITQVMNLYRKVAWDDVYQRWILPDILRYFKMYIYISEVRVFHTTEDKSPFVSGMTEMFPTPQLDVPKGVPNNLVPTLGGSSFKLLNSAINKCMPTIKLECNMCEFDMSDIMGHVANMSSAKSDEQVKPTIKIRVGNIREVQSYGLNREALNHGFDSIVDYVYSDDLLKKSTYITDQEDINEIEKDISNPINRLGVDVTADKIGRPFEYDLFDRDAAVLALQVNGIMQSLKAGDPTALLTLSGIRYDDPRSMATSYRGKGIIATLLESVLGQGAYQLSRAVRDVVDRGMDFIFGFPLRNGVRVGDVVESELTGNPIPIISAIKDYARGNATNMELKELYGRDNWESMLKDILEDVSRSAATSGIHDRFTDTINFILSDDPSAADVGRRIDELYDQYMKGLSSEANEDNNKGYQEPKIENTPYVSTSNEMGDPKDSYDPTFRGTSNEANDDRDYEGYQDPDLIRTPYISTANTGEVKDAYDSRLSGTSNEANDDNDYHGYKDPHIQRPPFISWANVGHVIDAFNPLLRGLSNEANDDIDRGFTDPLLENPAYTSTANDVDGRTELYEDKLHGLSDEANEDNDNGYTDPLLVNPDYVSTANSVDGRHELYDEELHGLSNETNEDNDNGYTEQTIDNPPYRSTATDRHIAENTQERELYSEANEDRDKGFSESSKIKDDK